MSNIRFFHEIYGNVHELPDEGTFPYERGMQEFFEKHLRTLTGIDFLDSEYSTGQRHSRRIDTLGIDEAGRPVVIEYKRHQDENVINQGLDYLAWLEDHQAEFRELVRERFGDGRVADIDFGTPRLLCIAADFLRQDQIAAQNSRRRVDLLRYRRYGDAYVALEWVYGPEAVKPPPRPTVPPRRAASKEQTAVAPYPVQPPVQPPPRVGDEVPDLPRYPPWNKTDEATRDLFRRLETLVKSLGNVKTDVFPSEISFKCLHRAMRRSSPTSSICIAGRSASASSSPRNTYATYRLTPVSLDPTTTASIERSSFVAPKTSAEQNRWCARPTIFSPSTVILLRGRRPPARRGRPVDVASQTTTLGPLQQAIAGDVSVAGHGLLRRRQFRRHDETQASNRHPDLPYASGAGLLLRRQDRLREAPGGRGRPLFPLAAPAVRQEPVSRHAEGAVRGRRAAVPRLGRPRPVGLVGQPCRGPAELRGGRLHAARLSAGGPRGSTGGPRGTGRRPGADGQRAGAPAASDHGVARTHRPERGGPGGRVRQADISTPSRIPSSPAATATCCAGSTGPSRTATRTSGSASSPASAASRRPACSRASTARKI